MRRLSAGALLIAALAGWGGVAPRLAAAPAPAPANMCEPDEAVIYTCDFGKAVASVCAGHEAANYRFGLPGRPGGMKVASLADWSNVRLGSAATDGGGHEAHARFSAGLIHYTVFAGMRGAAGGGPGQSYSGVLISQGKSAQNRIALLECPAGSWDDAGWIAALRAAAPPALRAGLEDAAPAAASTGGGPRR